MKRFALMMMIALMAVASFGSTARAQQDTCFGLSAADCKAIADADTGLAKLTSFEQTFDFQLKIKAQGMTVDVTSKGTGVLIADPAAMNATDPTAALGGLKLTLDVDGSAKVANQPDQAGKVQIVVTDGVIYFNDGKAGWQGAKLSDLLTQAMASQSGTGGAGAMTGQNAQIQALAGDPAVLGAIFAIPNIKGFITAQKSAGPDIGGKKMSAYVYNFDLKTLLAAKELFPLIKAIAKQANPTGPEIQDAQLEQIGPLATAILKESVVTVTRYVGDEDKQIHGIKIYVQLKIDGAMLGAAGDPVEALFSLDVKLDKLNGTFAVKAPEGAKMVTPPAPGAMMPATPSAMMPATANAMVPATPAK